MRTFLQLKKNLTTKVVVCTHTALKKTRKSLEDWKEVSKPFLSNGLVGRFHSSSQGQVNSAIAAKEHSRLHSASDWPSGSPDLKPLDYRLWSELERLACHRTHCTPWKASNNLCSE
ncbi:unnamed protein product [Nezara viridula]|uniref:Uncharacterized protein n=1 Tax=Nezara viridula TaxID=85310 RepID=A0A9P0HJ47_NEZVI|nr:unnamed protein product [Nezara viridula]